MIFSHFIILLTVSVSHVQTETDFQKLEKRLDLIDVKLAKLDALIGGLDLLCDTLNEIKIIRNNLDVKIDKDQDRVEYHANDTTDEWNNRKLRMVSLESEGIKENDANVTFIFDADDGYVFEWTITRDDSQVTRTQGIVNKEYLRNGRARFTTEVELRDVDKISWASLTILSSASNADIALDISALNITTVQIFNGTEYDIIEYTPEFVIPGNELEKHGFNATLRVTENVVDLVKDENYRLRLVFGYINTSVDPATFHYTSGREHEDFFVEAKNGSKDEIVIHVCKDLVKQGGVINLKIQEDTSGYVHIDNLFYGVEIRIINEDIGDIMPPNTIGVYKQEDVEYVTGQYPSVFCMAFGNPLPYLSIWKKRKDGMLTELRTNYEYVLESLMSTVKVVQFHEDSSKAVGEYVCRASNGMKTVEEERHYLPFTKVEIDENKTGLVKNTTRKTVVTCKATGDPTPDIKLTANYEYGENLLERETKQYTSRNKIKNHMKKVTLTISPPDEDISSIYCTASQIRRHIFYDFSETKRIEIRPPNVENEMWNATIIRGVMSPP